MHVHLVCRTTSSVDSVPTAALRRLVVALRAAGAHVEADIAPASSGLVRIAARQLALDLDRRWAQRRPDVVHAHGAVAATAALRAAAGVVPVVVTLDEAVGPPEQEAALAAAAAALVVRSSAERDGWVALGMPSDRVHVVPLAVDAVAGVPAERVPPCAVVTDARDEELERIVLSMRPWRPDVALAVVAPDTTGARAVGGETRGRPVVEVVEADDVLWRRACLVVAAARGVRHGGLVVEGAAHGVPAVARDVGAYADAVVDGATGLLLPATAGPDAIGRAVADLLADPLRLRGYGVAAYLRVRATRDPAFVASRSLGVYAAAVEAWSASSRGRDERPAPMAAAPSDAPDDPDARLRRDLVLEHLPVARRLAQRYAGRGQSVDDLVQVASLGLVKAARRFEPAHGTPFVAYAVPTMLGEVRRYFRDNAWAVHVPRGVQETALRVRDASDRLRQVLGHEVDSTAIAADLGLTVGDVDEARNASGVAFACRSLDVAAADDTDSSLAELLGSGDGSLEHVEAVESLRTAFAGLPPREREILALRFYGDLTQSEIAARIGISQMHVSRLLARTLRSLRAHVLDDEPLPASWAAPRAAEPA